jgi:hypothetical protein
MDGRTVDYGLHVYSLKSHSLLSQIRAETQDFQELQDFQAKLTRR